MISYMPMSKALTSLHTSAHIETVQSSIREHHRDEATGSYTYTQTGVVRAIRLSHCLARDARACIGTLTHLGAE